MGYLKKLLSQNVKVSIRDKDIAKGREKEKVEKRNHNGKTSLYQKRNGDSVPKRRQIKPQTE